MATKGRVIPNCVNASNPYHQCTESCLRKMADAKPQKKNSGSILAIPVLTRKKKQESERGSSRGSDNVPVSKALYPSDAPSPKSFHGVKKHIEPVSNGHSHSSLPYSGEIKVQDSSAVTEQYQSPRSEPTSEVPKSDLPQYTPSDAILTSNNSPKFKEKEEKRIDALQDLPPNHVPGTKTTPSPGASLDFDFTGIVHSDGESDDGAQSIASECRVSVGKYHVKESLASILLSIIDKHGDIAANCQLESLAMRSYYLECVCLVVQELQSSSVMQLTKSKVKELLAILKDAESAKISVAWLRDILNEIAEDIDLITQHRTLELQKLKCDHDVESTREEMESELEILAEKEKEIEVIKEQITEAKNRLMKLELKSSELSKSMLSIKSEIDKIHGKTLFETIWSRSKFDILGKKRKGEKRRIGQARSLAIEKRKKTLAKEYEVRAKSSVFVDKRIGERNDDLDEFGKAILRSQRERQVKLNKISKYNLSDGEDEDYGAEGLGAFSGRDDFEDEIFNEDDAEAIPFDKESAKSDQVNGYHMHMPGDDSEQDDVGNKHKSKKEVMEEIISKSKFYKAQKAKDKEENEHLMEELDKNFASLVETQALLSLTHPTKMNALKALVNKSIPNIGSCKDKLSATGSIKETGLEKPDTYDILVKEMALEMRARPSDRTKTPEEIAQEERERLEELEEERQKRMQAADDSSDEENEEIERPSTQKPKPLSGDDLGDSFSLEDDTQPKKGWVDEILEKKDQDLGSDDSASEDSESAEDVVEDSDVGIDEHENKLSLKDWEQSDDDIIGMDPEDEDEEREIEQDDSDDNIDQKKEMDETDKEKANSTRAVGISKTKDSPSAKKTKADVKRPSTQSLPYLIEAPKSLDEFSSLLDNCSNSDIIVVINRIRASNAIKLAAENRKKMQVFYGVLLQYFAVLAGKKPLNFELLNILVKPLIELSTEIPYFAAICARQRILRTRTQFVEAVKNPESSSWPSSKTLFLLRLWSLIFPCSDFRHPVMTPALLLMCEYLMRCPIVCGRDLSIGCFLCSMLLSITRQSKKFCPEAIMFLQTLLVAANHNKSVTELDSQFYHLMELNSLRPLLCIEDTVDEIRPLNFAMIMDMPENSSFYTSNDYRVSILAAVTETLRGFVNNYEGLSSFPEIFLPILTLLVDLSHQENMPSTLQDKLKEVADLIKMKVEESHALRRPLQMRKQKPVSIKLLNPKFEENYVKGRDYDPDRERAEMRKLKKRVRSEAKGAARELRKDNYFLLQLKERENAQFEEERAEKYGKAKAFLQEQEHAFKSGQLGNGRKKRR